MDKEKILLIASYPEGNEYENKVAKIEGLRKLGYDINIGYLVNLRNYGNGLQLPDEDHAIIDIKKNLDYFIKKYSPTITAFHNGMAFQQFWGIVSSSISAIHINHPQIKILVEGYDKNRLSNFTGISMLKNAIEKEHNLYDILWT